MAAITPDTLLRENVGSLTLYIAKFTTTFNNGDTWATGLGSNIVTINAQRNNQPTQTKEGMDVVNASGTLTLYTGENSVAADILIFART